MPEKSINAYFRIGLKLLVSIGCTELLIMVIFRFIRIETLMPPLLIDLTDTLLLCVMASFLILYWVVKPMKILEEREKAKEAIASMARFPEENPSPVMRFSFDGTILYANSASLPLRKLWNSEIGQKAPAGIANIAMDVCGSSVSKEVEVVCGDTIFSLIMACFKNTQDVNVYGRDITEHKKAEKEIHKEKAFSEAMLDSLPGIFYLFDHTGRFLRWNRAYETISGYSTEEIAAMSPLDFFTGDDRTLIKESIGKVFETGSVNVEGTFVSKDGRRIPHYFVGVRFVLGGEPCCIGMGIDITARKILEEQLRQSQKMEAVGTLAGGVAHDFNNILSAIFGYSHLILNRVEDNDPVKNYVEEIMGASKRAAVLTNNLLSFSRKQAVILAVIDLSEVIKSNEAFLRRLIREDIELKITCTEEPLTVLADRGQIEQVIMNLVANARDAMPNGGKIIVETSPVTLSQEFVGSHGYGTEGDYVMISLSDSGVGMDKETQLRIFEPFFTTKEQGQGTGLGLSMAFGIVKKHDGFINVYSEPGTGTIFRIYLPRVHDTAQIKNMETREVAPLRGGTETILLGEDDAALLKLSTRILSHYGYRVIEAVDGQDAIDKFAEYGESIDLVILDAIMPKKNGREACQEMRKVRPDLKVVFVSGYARDIFADSNALDGNSVFIQKPVSPDELVAKAREMLDK